MAQNAREGRLAAQNRKARHDYFIEDTFEAGVMLLGTEVKALHGTDRLESVTLASRDGQTEVVTRALFVMIGAAPNTDWLSGLVKTDPKGFVLTGAAVGRDQAYETSADGVFAVGDVRAGSVKRVASAVGEGSVVVSRIWDYVERIKQDSPVKLSDVSGASE